MQSEIFPMHHSPTIGKKGPEAVECTSHVGGVGTAVALGAINLSFGSVECKAGPACEPATILHLALQMERTLEKQACVVTCLLSLFLARLVCRCSIGRSVQSIIRFSTHSPGIRLGYSCQEFLEAESWSSHMAAVRD